MAGSGQDPSFFKAFSRDTTGRNVRVTNNFQVPLYSNVITTPAVPVVSQVGQLVFDTLDNHLYVSKVSGGVIVWAQCDN
jgi:hypothetical protein